VGFGVAVAVGNIIGSGILRAPSAIAGLVPGAAFILGLWILGGVQSLLQANVYAELATALPRTGGPYVYARKAFGDVPGLIVGWSLWLSKMAGAAAASVSFAEFLPLLWPAAAFHKIAVALGVQFALYAANITGLRQGRAVQEVTTIGKAVMMVVFVVAAAVLAGPGEPPHTLAPAPVLSWVGVALAYKLILGAYSGWAAPTFFSGENKAPGRSIPRALFIGILLTGALYVSVNAALLHALGSDGVARQALPFVAVLGRFGGTLPSLLFALTAMVTVASCANANIMGAPRVLLALAEDGLLPRSFAGVNRGGSPTVSLLATALGTLALAASGTFALVFGLIATLDTLAGIIVEAGFFRLRAREPELARPFRALGYPLLPLLVLAVDIVLLAAFASADVKGGIAAGVMVLLCIPFAVVARRARR
jgi:APA family basic amino acid/polyamine antiporter